MDESESFFKERQTLKATLPEIERKENEAIEDPELCGLVSRLSMATVVYEVNDERIKDLQKQLNVRVGAIRSRRKEYFKQLATISKELSALTAPAIAKAIEKLHHELRPLKIERKVVGRTSGGFSMVARVIVETNEDGIAAAQRIVKDAVATLGAMNYEPISKIQAFVEGELTRIRSINLMPARKEIDEIENARREFLSSPLNS
jgi:DNA-binding transcriptional regulator YdaS (Cro superfamily)